MSSAADANILSSYPQHIQASNKRLGLLKQLWLSIFLFRAYNCLRRCAFATAILLQMWPDNINCIFFYSLYILKQEGGAATFPSSFKIPSSGIKREMSYNTKCASITKSTLMPFVDVDTLFLFCWVRDELYWNVVLTILDTLFTHFGNMAPQLTTARAQPSTAPLQWLTLLLTQELNDLGFDCWLAKHPSLLGL